MFFKGLIPIYIPTSAYVFSLRSGIKQRYPMITFVQPCTVSQSLIILNMIWLFGFANLVAHCSFICISWILMRLDIFACLLLIWFPLLWSACFKSVYWIGLSFTSWFVEVLYFAYGCKYLFLVCGLFAHSLYDDLWWKKFLF